MATVTVVPTDTNIDEGVDTADDDTTYVSTSTGSSELFNLGNMPSDFVEATAVTIRIRARRTTDKSDPPKLTALKLMQSDAVTDITDTSGILATTSASYTTIDNIKTITGATSKTVWDGALLRYQVNGSSGQMRVTAIDVVITYTTSSGQVNTTSKVFKMLLGCR